MTKTSAAERLLSDRCECGAVSYRVPDAFL
jgi:hypothetical protein